MQKMYKPARVVVIFVVVVVMLSFYISELYRMQIYESWMTVEDDPITRRTVTRTVTLPAARGNIYDRNGILLASGRPTYNIRFDRALMRHSEDMNDTILRLIYLTMDENIPYIDTLPITRGAPFGYISDMTRTQRRWLDAYLEFFSLDPDIPASELLAWMRTHYGIDFTVSTLDARLIIGVRYELAMRVIIGTISPYVFARDISTDFVTYIEELGFLGVHIEKNYIREYHTTYAAHILGYIRRMSPEQYEIYRELGYPMDAMVGQIGVEFAFEDILRGIEGRQSITSAIDGTIINVVTTQEPQPGNHVSLTICIDLQIATEHALRTQIDRINTAREEAAILNPPETEEDDRVAGGAVVVTDVRTGEVLAAASYPTFNPITLSQDFAFLSTDPMLPMFNRATHGRFIPGSTFKMITGFAGLRDGHMTRYFEVFDTGRYDRHIEYDGFAPTCWVFPISRVGHGSVNIVQAIECSCNYYFMFVADRQLGLSLDSARLIARTAEEFGLGVSTGIEIPEATGRIATPEWKREALDAAWWLADTIMTSFGQGDNRFTPLQLANYTATIANGGTLYALSILRRVMSSDHTEQLHTHEPRIIREVEGAEHLALIQEGMLAVSRGNRGTARAVFRDYPIAVASKTGTAQVEGRDVNDGIFVAYAPFDNPEIAIAIVVEKGGSGSGVMDIARMIFDHYFRSESAVHSVPYGELIP